jgi:flagellar biosynthesis chaperone FliJ
VPKIIDYEKIGTLKRRLEKIMEDFVGFENQLYPLQETYKNLNKSLEKTLEGMTSTNNILKYIINH